MYNIEKTTNQTKDQTKPKNKQNREPLGCLLWLSQERYFVCRAAKLLKAGKMSGPSMDAPGSRADDQENDPLERGGQENDCLDFPRWDCNVLLAIVIKSSQTYLQDAVF